MNALAVKTDQLTRDFGRVRALDGLSIDVPPGHVLALLGPNGAGKTTFLKLVMGLIEPTRGQAWVLGAPSRSQPASVSSRIGVVGDGHEPPRWATLRDLEALQAGASPRFDRELFRELCSTRRLLLRSRFAELSKGQKRWALAALAFAARPDLLLMDEPADGLDPSARRGLYDCLRDHVSGTDATAIVSTHIISDIERVADDVAIIDRGKLILHAPLEDLREQVRQVEVPDAVALPDLGPNVIKLGSLYTGEMAMAWVRCTDSDETELRRRAGPDARIRTVGLETLYLAVCERREVA